MQAVVTTASRDSWNGDFVLNGRLLVVAFEGWNDAGEAATGAVRVLQEQLDVSPLFVIDPELYYDYQFNRPRTLPMDRTAS